MTGRSERRTATANVAVVIHERVGIRIIRTVVVQAPTDVAAVTRADDVARSRTNHDARGNPDARTNPDAGARTPVAATITATPAAAPTAHRAAPWEFWLSAFVLGIAFATLAEILT